MFVGFSVGENEIILLFDPPHLMKGIRNQLIISDATFSWHKEKQKTTWDDIVTLYEKDFSLGRIGCRALPKLSDKHIYINCLRK